MCIYFMAGPTYHLQTLHGITNLSMHTTQCLLNMGAGLSLVRSSLVQANLFHRIKHDKLSTIFTATTHPLLLYVLVLLCLRTDNLHIRIWLGTALHLAANILFGLVLIDRFVRIILTSEWRLAFFHTRLVTKTARQQLSEMARKLLHVRDSQHTAAHLQLACDVVRVVGQLVLESYNKNHFFLTSKTLALLKAELDALHISRHGALASRGVGDISSGNSVYIHVSNIFGR